MSLKHYLIAPTWRCQNSCSYCWVGKTVKTRPELYEAQTRPVEDWLRAIERDKPDLIDIAGGEPLLWHGLVDLIRQTPDTKFALSTNVLDTGQLGRLVQQRYRNVFAIAVSYHPESASRLPGYVGAFSMALLSLAYAGYPVSVSVVDYKDNKATSAFMADWVNALGGKPVLSPYEDVTDIRWETEQGLCCQGGTSHLVIGPDGTAWPCLTALRSPFWKELQLGNWLDGTIDLTKKPQPCFLNCIDYYVLKDQHANGDMWGVEVQPSES